MKPVKYVAVSHHHYDHIGGLRAAAAMGATILVEKGTEPVVRPLLEAHHTQPQDELEKRRSANQPVGSLEVFEGKKIIGEGGQDWPAVAAGTTLFVIPILVFTALLRKHLLRGITFGAVRK